MRIENVDWQITTRCTRKCKYCFGASDCNDLPLHKMKEIVDILILQGTKQIGITGGEPLCYPDIEELIEYISNKGLDIYISTNCDLYKQYSALIKEKVSIIGIPIDGATRRSHDLLRGDGSFKNVIYALDDICASSCRTKIKVGTVVTNLNVGDLIAIEEMLSTYQEKLNYWKLYELVAYPRNRTAIETLRTTLLSGGLDLGKYLKSEKIVLDTASIRNRSYFFLRPDGSVFVPELSTLLSEERVIGNILVDDISDIKSSFLQMVNLEGYNNEFRYMRGTERSNKV